MEFLLGTIAVIFCIAMALKGYLAAVVIGGFLGSFLGVAGFGGAVSGMIPGAVIGTIIAVSISKGKT